MIHLLSLLPLDDPPPTPIPDSVEKLVPLVRSSLLTDNGIVGGHSAYLLICSALVLLMTPGLAFFYGGLTRAKSTLNMMMMSFMSIGIVSILWVFYGFSESFGNTHHQLFGSFKQFAFLEGSIQSSQGTFDAYGNVPDFAFVAFQLMFAIITVALISGSLADRMKFSAWIIFTPIWMTLVYFPVAAWVFNFGSLAPSDYTGKVGRGAAYLFEAGTGGWIVNKLGALDFAGGTAVHINAAASALAMCLILGKRKGWPQQAMRPHNVPFVMLGSGLLWFGWFGFNAGSALAASGLSAQAFINTQVATAAAALGWLVVEKLRDGKMTGVGFASGAVAGLVAITPSCGSVTAMGAIGIGFIAGIICCFAIVIKNKFGFDDSLDVVGVHLVGGIVGTLLIGVFAENAIVGNTVNPVKSLLHGGSFDQLGRQALAAGAVLVYSFVVTFVIGFILDKTIGLRIKESDEISGIDLAEHGESAYEIPAAVAH